MNTDLYNLGQQQRSESERRLPEWERAALDQRRNAEMMNINQNPAIWDKLRLIEAKLDKVLALLESKP